MNWQIITDSSCDLKEWDRGIPFDTVPFVIRVDDTDYVDTPDLDIETLVTAMEKSTVSRTSCPSPEAWYEVFLRADRTIALTISANLSGMEDNQRDGQKLSQNRRKGGYLHTDK